MTITVFHHAVHPSDFQFGYAFAAVWLLGYVISATEQVLRNRYRAVARSSALSWPLTRFRVRGHWVATGLISAAEPLPGLNRVAQIVGAVMVAAASITVGATTTVLLLHNPHADPYWSTVLGLITAVGVEALIAERAHRLARSIRKPHANRRRTARQETTR